MNFRVAVFALLMTGLAGMVAAQQTGSEEPPADPTITEDVPELLKPRQARTEAEDDLLTSGAHFAQARLYLQRQNEPLALRHFQRAWRFNQDRVRLLDQVVALASKLKRNEEAARYAVLSAERRPRDARLLIQLGGLLGQQNDTARALKMYEQAIALQRDAQLTPQAVAIRIEMGRLYYLQEDYPNAARCFTIVRDALDDAQVVNDQQRAALLPKPYALYSLIAASFLQDERFDEAAAMHRKADSFEPNAPRLDFHLAEVALHKKDYAQARTLLAGYLDSKSAAAGMEAYRVLQKLCDNEHADPAAARAAFLAELRRHQADDKENVALGYFLAGELLAADQLDDARALYAEMLKRQPTADAYLGLAEVDLRRKNIEQLMETIEQVVLATDSLDLLEEKLAALVGDPALVKRMLAHGREKCAASAPNEQLGTSLAAAHLAIKAQQLDAFDEFAQIAANAAGGDKKVAVLEQLALAIFIAEDAPRATQLFQQALAEHPDEKAESTLQFYLAGAAQYAGDTEVALRAAQRAAELRSDSPRFASREPWILYQAKRHEQSEQQYLALLKKYEANRDAPGSRDVLREARLILSNIAVERKEYPRAEEWLAQVLDEFPEDIGAKNDLGYLWADQGKHLERATRMIRVAVAAEPENVAYRDSLGWAYYRLGRFAEAVKELEIATAGDDPDGVILDHLGDAHLGNKQPDHAIEVWNKALTAFRKAEQMDRVAAIEAKIKKHSQD